MIKLIIIFSVIINVFIIFEENLFATSYSYTQYYNKRPDVLNAKWDALDHYNRYGKNEGMQKPIICTPEDYYKKRQDVFYANWDALEHYNQYGKNEGMCNPVENENNNNFSTCTYEEYYAERPDVIGMDALHHYNYYGKNEGMCNPVENENNNNFSTCTYEEYYAERPDVIGMDALHHYNYYGKNEGMCNPIENENENESESENEEESENNNACPLDGYLIPVVGSKNLLIVVEETLKYGIQCAIKQYINDLESKGKHVALTYWRHGNVSQLRELIKKAQRNNSIEGAFLIGNLPAAWYERNSTVSNNGSEYTRLEKFPTDIYFMDVDAVWTDTDNNGIFDKHSNIEVDIFSSRLTGSVEEINYYFQKLHNYKKNGSLINPSAFLFVDKDWQDYVAPLSTFNLPYNNFNRYLTPQNTFKNDYLNFMTQKGAEFIYQWIHSAPQLLYFSKNNETLFIGELKTAEVIGSFYNLFNCSASRFTEENLANTYLKTKYGLATIGSTKTGGMYNPNYFHAGLAEGKTWGESYKEWYRIKGVHDDFWFLGIMIMGDPMITLTRKTQVKLRQMNYYDQFTTLEINQMKKKLLIFHKKLKNK